MRCEAGERERERKRKTTTIIIIITAAFTTSSQTQNNSRYRVMVPSWTAHWAWTMVNASHWFALSVSQKDTRKTHQIQMGKNKNQQNDGMHSAKISVVIKVNKPKGLGGLLVKSSVNCNTWSLRIFFPLSQRPHSDMIRLHCENQRTRITPSCLTDFKGISATHTHKINRLLSQLIVSAVLNALPVLQHQHCHSVALTNL